MSGSISAKDVADAIIRNELERREDFTPAAIPDARPLENTAGIRPQQPNFNGIPLDNPWVSHILRQLVTSQGGGRT